MNMQALAENLGLRYEVPADKTSQWVLVEHADEISEALLALAPHRQLLAIMTIDLLPLEAAVLVMEPLHGVKRGDCLLQQEYLTIDPQGFIVLDEFKVGTLEPDLARHFNESHQRLKEMD